MVTVIKNSQEKLQHRLRRRGYSDEECEDMLKNRKSGAVVLKKPSLKGKGIKGFTVNNC